ncbi:MAG: hypothetical protein IT372_28785 [Polyangiaceae bacterium]|nr:hypothetical protein [Polyangiaceae bacterium]
MEMHIQFGYGMKDHCRALLDSWDGGAVILSPRDLDDEQLQRVANEIHETASDTSVFVDPQFYLPHSDYERLVSHSYWPKWYETGTFWGGDELRHLLIELRSLNQRLGCEKIILPGLLAGRVDDDWLMRQAAMIDEATQIFAKPIFATVALGADAVRMDDDVHTVLDAAMRWNVQGIYLVLEHPRGDYLVRDAAWMANALDLVAGLRIKDKAVLVGYCNHQMLLLACAGATAIASGTWMNVRSFPPEKFRSQYDEEQKRRSIWYYCPQALSEYKLPFLDIARKQGALEQMAPPAEMNCSYANILFAGAQPSTVKFTEQAAFRHYLDCLRRQVECSSHETFDATADAQERMLDRAQSLLQDFQSLGIFGQMRDFSESVDVNRAALNVLRNSRGAVLRRRWAQL